MVTSAIKTDIAGEYAERNSEWRIKPGVNPEYTKNVVVLKSNSGRGHTMYRRLDNGDVAEIPTSRFLECFEPAII
jgi:hypothetical protein